MPKPNQLKYLFFIAVCLAFLSSARSEEITLGWDPSTDTNVVGYKLYYGLEETEPTIVTVDTNQVTISDLQKGSSYFFYVTAFNADALESAPSETINYTVPFAKNDSPLLIAENLGDGGMILRALGAVMQNYTLQSRTDLNQSHWNDLYTIKSDDYGWIEIYLPADKSREMFRLVTLPWY
ncbi:MAG: fibronectin type III domain-containing protein [Verrucomicrobiota bacterium]